MNLLNGNVSLHGKRGGRKIPGRKLAVEPEWKTLAVDNDLRKELSRPFGRILNDNFAIKRICLGKKICAVGDVTVATLLGIGCMPKVAVFDYRTGRVYRAIPIIKAVYRKPVRIRNRTGTLSAKLWEAVGKAYFSRDYVGIRVYGEEDLAALACIHFAKTGDLVMYGLRGRGLVVIRVGPGIKAFVSKVIKRMNEVSGYESNTT